MRLQFVSITRSLISLAKLAHPRKIASFAVVGIFTVFAGLVGIESWFKSQPALVVELKFVPSEPEYFECMAIMRGVQIRGHWSIHTKNISTTPILLDELLVVTWHPNGGTVVTINERNPIKQSGGKIELARMDSFRIDAGAVEWRAQEDWFPEFSSRSRQFYLDGGCGGKPLSWNAFKRRPFMDNLVSSDFTVNLNLLYGNGQQRSVTAKYDPRHQAWITPQIRQIMPFGLRWFVDGQE